MNPLGVGVHYVQTWSTVSSFVFCKKNAITVNWIGIEDSLQNHTSDPNQNYNVDGA